MTFVLDPVIRFKCQGRRIGKCPDWHKIYSTAFRVIQLSISQLYWYSTPQSPLQYHHIEIYIWVSLS